MQMFTHHASDDTRPPHYPLSFDPSQSESELIQKLKEFLTTKIYPNGDIKKFSRLTGGLTNMLYKVFIGNSVILVRVNGIGTENIIDRDKEVRYMISLSDYKMAPKIHATFENGYVYDFIEGEPLQPKELPLHAAEIAKELAKFHKVPIEPIDHDKSPSLFKTIRKWLSDVKKFHFQDQAKQTEFEKIDLMTLCHEMDEMEVLLKDCKITFCHNDLLSLNIIYNAGTNSISFIDYEYCSYNFRAFDIGNHFCEYTGFDLVIPNFPDENQQKKFITVYLTEYNNMQPKDQEVADLVAEVGVFAMLANVFWGIWGIQQAYYSDIEFDYLDYSAKRLKWFHDWKDDVVQKFKIK